MEYMCLSTGNVMAINAIQERFTPTSFGALPLELQVWIIEQAGDDIAKTLGRLEQLSHEWQSITRNLWAYFTPANFPDELINIVADRLNEQLGHYPQWKEIYKYLSSHYSRVIIRNDTLHTVTLKLTIPSVPSAGEIIQELAPQEILSHFFEVIPDTQLMIQLVEPGNPTSCCYVQILTPRRKEIYTVTTLRHLMMENRAGACRPCRYPLL